LLILVGGAVGFEWARAAGCYGLSCAIGPFWGVCIGALVADIGFVVLLFLPRRSRER
jgi:hypothetical protein